MNSFTIKKRIYYHDTDCGGVVYYANYLKYFEEARTEHLLAKRIDLNELAKKGVLFAVAGLEIRYKRPARYGDELVILSKIDKMGPASVDFYHDIKAGGLLLAECRTTLVFIGAGFKPQAMPEDVLSRLKSAG